MAITIKPLSPVTDDDIIALSESNPGYQFERTASGQLVVTPTSGRSGRLEARLVRQLESWAEHYGGVVFSSTTGFVLPDTAFVQPDAAWLRQDRWDALGPEAQDEILHLCPDAAFEIRAKTSRLTDLQAKTAAYARNGARIAVLIDPYQRTVEIYRPQGHPVRVDQPASLNLDPELPGFILDLAALFGH